MQTHPERILGTTEDTGRLARCESLPRNEEQCFPVCLAQRGQCVNAGIALDQLLLRRRSARGMPQVANGLRPMLIPSRRTSAMVSGQLAHRHHKPGEGLSGLARDVVDPPERNKVGLGNKVFGVGRIRVTSRICMQAACVGAPELLKPLIAVIDYSHILVMSPPASLLHPAACDVLPREVLGRCAPPKTRRRRGRPSPTLRRFQHGDPHKHAPHADRLPGRTLGPPFVPAMAPNRTSRAGRLSPASLTWQDGSIATSDSRHEREVWQLKHAILADRTPQPSVDSHKTLQLKPYRIRWIPRPTLPLRPEPSTDAPSGELTQPIRALTAAVGLSPVLPYGSAVSSTVGTSHPDGVLQPGLDGASQPHAPASGGHEIWFRGQPLAGPPRRGGPANARQLGDPTYTDHPVRDLRPAGTEGSVGCGQPADLCRARPVLLGQRLHRDPGASAFHPRLNGLL